MAVAEDDRVVHGPLELLCTVDEETGPRTRDEGPADVVYFRHNGVTSRAYPGN